MEPDPLLLLVAFALITALAGLLAWGLKLQSEPFSHYGQGLLGIASTLALMTGVWLYYSERRNMPKIDLDARYTVVALSPAESGEGRALVQFVAAIQNLGSHRLRLDCVALDAHGVPATGELVRNPDYQNDLILPSLLPETAQGTAWQNCLTIEQDRWLKNNPDLGASDYRRPTTGFRYRRVALEPGERKTRHFELIVPCDYGAVRFTFDVPARKSNQIYEIKKVVPLTEACNESRRAKASRPVPSSA